MDVCEKKKSLCLFKVIYLQITSEFKQTVDYVRDKWEHISIDL